LSGATVGPAKFQEVNMGWIIEIAKLLG